MRNQDTDRNQKREKDRGAFLQHSNLLDKTQSKPANILRLPASPECELRHISMCRAPQPITAGFFEPLTFRRGSVTYAKFAPDGRTLLVANADNNDNEAAATVSAASRVNPPLNTASWRKALCSSDDNRRHE